MDSNHTIGLSEMMVMKLLINIAAIFVSLFLLGSASVLSQTASPLSRDSIRSAKGTCLPTGVCLDAAGTATDVGNMPLALALSPEGDRLVVSLSGWREQGLEVVERGTGRILQRLAQPGAFFGLAFSPDGKELYASGGDTDTVFRYTWRDRQATPDGMIALGVKDPKKPGTRFPAGMSLSADGKKLFVAENVSDTLAVIDVATGKVEQRLPTDAYPYSVAVTSGGKIFVSAWGGSTVSVIVSDGAKLKEDRKIQIGRHPSALLLNSSGSRLYVACASTNS